MNPVFRFVIEDEAVCQLAQDPNFDLHANWSLFDHGVHAWSLQTYLELRQSSVEVELGTDIRNGRINFVHAVSAPRITAEGTAFVVSLQADYPRVAWADLHIVQNPCQQTLLNSFWIPHWPQPGLIPRLTERSAISTVGYAGELPGLAGGLAEWHELIEPLGLTLQYIDKPRWNDYSEIDILLGVRTFDKNTHSRKPPTKLFNAWLAGVAFIGGMDSAFAHVGRPGIDYLRAESPHSAGNLIRMLASDDRIYRSLVEAGRNQVRRYSRDRIRQDWIELIDVELVPRWRDFETQGRRRTIGWRVGRYGWRAKRQLRGILKHAALRPFRGPSITPVARPKIPQQ